MRWEVSENELYRESDAVEELKCQRGRNHRCVGRGGCEAEVGDGVVVVIS